MALDDKPKYKEQPKENMEGQRSESEISQPQNGIYKHTPVFDVWPKISLRMFDIFIYETLLCLSNAFYMAVMEEAGKTLSWHLATEPPIAIKATREMLQDTTNRWGSVHMHLRIRYCCVFYLGQVP